MTGLYVLHTSHPNDPAASLYVGYIAGDRLLIVSKNHDTGAERRIELEPDEVAGLLDYLLLPPFVDRDEDAMISLIVNANVRAIETAHAAHAAYPDIVVKAADRLREVCVARGWISDAAS